MSGFVMKSISQHGLQLYATIAAISGLSNALPPPLAPAYSLDSLLQ